MDRRAAAGLSSIAGAPDGWTIQPLEELCQRITSGGTPARSSEAFYLAGTIPWFKTQELSGWYLEDSGENITEHALASSAAKLFPPNTVLMAMYGDGRTITNLGILRRSAASNQACCALIHDPCKSTPLYILYSLRFHRKDFLRLATGGAQRNLSVSLIRSFRIRVPPLVEQERISQILGSLDDKIDLNRRMNQTLESMARAIFKSWFVDFDPVREGHPLFPSSLSESVLGPVPEGWHIADAYTISRVIYGAPFSSERFNEEGHGMPVIRIRDLAIQAPKIFTTEQHPNGNVVRPGDILVGMDGEFKCSLWMGPPGLLNQRVCMFKPKPGIPRLFVRFCLQDPLAFFERSKVGTTVIHLGKADIDTFRFIVPDRPVVDLFAKTTEPIVELMLAKEAESRTLAALRDTLLPKLLSGEIRVKQAEKVVEEMV